MGYTKSALSGFSGQTFIKIAGNALVLVKMAVLARLLTPSDFGLFSLVVIALGLTEAFTQTGVNTTIIQSKHPVSYFINTAWVIAVVRGFAIGGIMLVLGGVMTEYYQQPQLFPLILAAASVPVIKGFINPAIIGLHKDLHFLSDSVYRFSLVVVENLAIIGLVFLFHSIFAWIAGLIVVAVFEVLISFLFFKLKPQFNYQKNPATEIFKQVKVLSLSSFLSYLIENLDNLVIGKILGEHGLGLYQNGYSLAHEANFEIAKSVHHGTLPVYTKIATDTKRLKKAFLKTSFFTILGVTAISLPLFLFPELLVKIIFGPQWLGTIPLLPWLGLAGILNAISLLCYAPLIAKHRVHLINWHQVVHIVAMVVLVVWLGQTYGLLGAVMGVVISRLIALPIALLAVWKQIE